jgi:phosphatidylinositol alpha-1,6-mannosyltransferase
VTSKTVLSVARAGALTRPPAADRVLLLAPSQGLGGGIERYLQSVQSAFDDGGVAFQRLDLVRPGAGGHRQLHREAAAVLDTLAGPARLVVGHRALLPVAAALALSRKVGGISVICHGSDVWGSRRAPRRMLESLLMRGFLVRGADVRLVAVSSFTAGTLLPRGRAAILPPGLSRPWFGQLVAAAGRTSADGGRTDLEIMTAFRLDEWRDKGLPQLTAAIAQLNRADIRLTVCGSGQPPADLLAHVRRYPWCVLRPRLTDAELAAQFARAGLFVLATRTRAGRRPSGEGFGLVLLEAQVAGTAVVGPAHGGSPDAYVDGVTGATPRDESAAALAEVLDSLAGQPARLDEMGRLGAAWARMRFAPDRYAAAAAGRLL